MAPPPVGPGREPWGLVVPVKHLPLAKSRLAGYGQQARQDLALAFAADVVQAGLSCPVITTVVVVTDDSRARALLTGLGAVVVDDDPDAGLNPALSHGADLARSAHGAQGIVTVSADLPALTPDDLAAALAQVPPGSRGFVIDTDGTGTTLLAAASGAALDPSYGAGSAERHRRSGALPLVVGAALRRDVDTQADLEAALALGVGVHTTAAVAALVVGPRG